MDGSSLGKFAAGSGNEGLTRDAPRGLSDLLAVWKVHLGEEREELISIKSVRFSRLSVATLYEVRRA
jgi:hypothetical protein